MATSTYEKQIRPRKAGETPTMKKNAAGALSHTVDRIQQVKRFLVLGTEGGTYYTGEFDHTKDNYKNLKKAIDESGLAVVDAIVWASNNAPRRNAVNFAVAVVMAKGSVVTKTAMAQVMPAVFKTGTDFFEFINYVTKMRGWGNALRNACRNFFNTMDLDKLSLWMVKYRQRSGWTWDDVLRVTHPNTDEVLRDNLYHSVTGGTDPMKRELPMTYQGFLTAQGATTDGEVIRIVRDFELPWEALRDEQRTPEVWKALLPKMGNVALLRNLANLTRNGVLTPLGKETQYVVGRLRTANNLHPVKVYDALLTYTGRNPNAKGRGRPIVPLPEIVTALEFLLSKSFGKGVDPTGRNFLVAIDTSGSMGGGYYMSRQAVAPPIEQALVLGKAIKDSETVVHTIGANTHVHPLDLTGSWSRVRQTATPGGGTDMSLPYEHALAQRLNVDVFVTITDNETWAHARTPAAAFRNFQRVVNPDAKAVTVALTATRSTLADGDDMLDVVGWSADTVEVVNAFAAL